jgi:two-component system cell cycle sensor histidine kinase/response regulator CckA
VVWFTRAAFHEFPAALVLLRGESTPERSVGYQVLESKTALQALEMAQKHAGTLDILLTDVVMPELRGPELARRVTECHPEVHVVYMSGYAEGLPETDLPANSAFLQKPFRFATLLEQLKLVQRRS